LTWLEPPDLPCNSVYTRPLSFRGRRDGPTESACVHRYFRSRGSSWLGGPISPVVPSSLLDQVVVCLVVSSLVVFLRGTRRGWFRESSRDCLPTRCR
jgi:hypothetical protein